MLVCLNLRSMILTMNYTLSSVGFLHFLPYLSKTGHLVEVRFLGAGFDMFFISSHPPGQGILCIGLDETKGNHLSLAG